MNEKIETPLHKVRYTIYYLVLDIISTLVGWLFLSFYRKNLYSRSYDLFSSEMIFNDTTLLKCYLFLNFYFYFCFSDL